MTLKVLTANRLTDGISVWFNSADEWQETLVGALAVSDAADIEKLEAVGRKAAADNLVVDVNLIDVNDVDGTLVPLRQREKIRADGPTIDYAPAFGATKTNAA